MGKRRRFFTKRRTKKESSEKQIIPFNFKKLIEGVTNFKCFNYNEELEEIIIVTDSSEIIIFDKFGKEKNKFKVNGNVTSISLMRSHIICLVDGKCKVFSNEDFSERKNLGKASFIFTHKIILFLSVHRTLNLYSISGRRINKQKSYEFFNPIISINVIKEKSGTNILVTTTEGYNIIAKKGFDRRVIEKVSEKSEHYLTTCNDLIYYLNDLKIIQCNSIGKQKVEIIEFSSSEQYPEKPKEFFISYPYLIIILLDKIKVIHIATEKVIQEIESNNLFKMIEGYILSKECLWEFKKNDLYLSYELYLENNKYQQAINLIPLLHGITAEEQAEKVNYVLKLQSGEIVGKPKKVVRSYKSKEEESSRNRSMTITEKWESERKKKQIAFERKEKRRKELQKKNEEIRRKKNEERKKKQQQLEIEREKKRIRKEKLKREAEQRLREESLNDIPKSQWFSTILQKYPPLLATVERIKPINKNKTFGRYLQYSESESTTGLTRNDLFQLIMQHLDSLRYNMSLRTLQNEAGLRYEQVYGESQLRALLSIGINDIDSLWDLELQSEDITPIHLKFPGIGAEDTVFLEEGKNIWEEPPDSPDNIILASSTHLLAASLNKLIEHLTPQNYLNEEMMKFIDIFLTTYQSFTTPTVLINKLRQRYKVPHPPDLLEEEFSHIRNGIQKSVEAVLIKWIKNYSFDINERLKLQFREFIDTIRSHESKAILFKLLSDMDRIKIQKKIILKIKSIKPPAPILPKNIFHQNLSLLSINEEELARQITLFTFEIYKLIQPREFLLDAYNNEKYKHRAPNMRILLANYDKIVYWVKSSILSFENKRERGKIISFFIKISQYLLKINNFNDLSAIVQGLISLPIERLKSSWNEIPKSLYKSFQNEIIELLDKSNDFRNYRFYLDDLDSKNWCIPNIMVTLNDLSQLDKLHQNYVISRGDFKLINFEKRRALYSIIRNTLKFKTDYPIFIPVFQIQNLIKNLKIPIPEREIISLSNLREI